MEQLFESLREDLATLKRKIAADIKDLRREVIDLGQRVDTVEQSQYAREEELDCHKRELISLQDRGPGQQITPLQHSDKRGSDTGNIGTPGGFCGAPLLSHGAGPERAGHRSQQNA
ncbi:hypothetical protein NDU88_008752 [Pleurodeles waltl]|uniref:Uncharacterized protein n=1 Tax=Pleurodeles waltl TaxID=8319 RepID=A0AAV7RU05_PLEWA|nr:hypothetical protein NDU88_008752 [Pleurodeles waltl]